MSLFNVTLNTNGYTGVQNIYRKTKEKHPSDSVPGYTFSAQMTCIDCTVG